MKPEQPQLPFNEAPTGQVVERVRPEGIPEDAWTAIQGLHRRAAEREPFSIGGRIATREQLQAEADANAMLAMTRER